MARRAWLNAWLLVCAALLVGALSACVGALLGPGSCKLSVRGNSVADVQSMFVIVAKDAAVEGFDSPDKISSLVSPDASSKYVSIKQYKVKQGAQPADGARWVESASVRGAAELEYAISSKATEVTLEIDRQLVKLEPTVCALVVVNFGSKGWRAEKFNTGEIEHKDSLAVVIDAGQVSRKAD